ncbi:MAG: aldo/keto reductase [Verrucomicrobiota bacterium JB024]|nr:aldo/keto reductase [Verrucomicrobiota bacterium JB024]
MPLLSPVTLGTWSLIGDANWGQQSRADSEAAIEASLEAGITAFDTAPMYGDGASETLLGEVLKHRREQIFLADKVMAPLTAAGIKASCEASLRRLQTDYVDLLQIHWPDRDTPMGESAEALIELKEAGKIRAIGVCNFGVEDLREASDLMPISTNQLPYSLLWRGAEFELLPLCRRLGIRLMTYSSLMQGLLTGKFASAAEVPEGRARTKHFAAEGRPRIRHGEAGHEKTTFATIKSIRDICEASGVSMSTAALTVLLSKPEVVTVIAGARNAAQARENANVLQARLDPVLIDRLWLSSETLKEEIGPEVDPWMTPSRLR